MKFGPTSSLDSSARYYASNAERLKSAEILRSRTVAVIAAASVQTTKPTAHRVFFDANDFRKKDGHSLYKDSTRKRGCLTYDCVN